MQHYWNCILKNTNKLTQQKETIWATYTRSRGPCLPWHTLPRNATMESSWYAKISLFHNSPKYYIDPIFIPPPLQGSSLHLYIWISIQRRKMVTTKWDQIPNTWIYNHQKLDKGNGGYLMVVGYVWIFEAQQHNLWQNYIPKFFHKRNNYRNSATTEFLRKYALNIFPYLPNHLLFWKYSLSTPNLVHSALNPCLQYF